MAKIIVSTPEFQAWCKEFDAKMFAAFPTRLLSQLIELLPPIDGVLTTSYAVLLVEPVVRKKDKAPFLRLRWRFSPEAVPLARKLGGRFRAEWKAWDIPDDGTAFDAVVAQFSCLFPWIVEMPSGSLVLSPDAKPRKVDPAYGLLPEPRWVHFATVLDAVRAVDGYPRGLPKILDVSVDGSCRFQSLGHEDGGVFTRHEIVVLCVTQRDSSVLCVEWDVEAKTPVRIVYGRASKSMLAMVGDAVDGLRQGVVVEGRKARSVPVVLRLYEGHLSERHSIRVRLFDDRVPEEPSEARDRPLLVEIDGARVEEAMASDDPYFEILGVVLATVERATGLSSAAH